VHVHQVLVGEGPIRQGLLRDGHESSPWTKPSFSLPSRSPFAILWTDPRSEWKPLIAQRRTLVGGDQ